MSSVKVASGQGAPIIKSNERGFWQKLRDKHQLLVLLLPFMAFVVVFNYLPIWGWLMAFQNYKPATGLTGSPFIGMANFQELFSDDRFFKAFRNTLAISSLKIAFGFLSSLMLALMLNEVRNMLFKRTVQTISYLPYFVSWVVAANIVYMSLSPTDGIINLVLTKLGLAENPIPFMGDPKYFYWVAAFSNVWKNVGWGAIIYLSAMTGIDPELYEAASIDGAGRLRRIMSITIPSIIPTIKIVLVLNIGHLMTAGFEHIYLLSNSSNMEMSQTIEVYVFTYALRQGRLSYGTAIGMFNSLISLAIIFICNAISKRIDGYGIF
jgi:putative aldouronate transport system permease protein